MSERFGFIEQKHVGPAFGWRTAYLVGEPGTKAGIAITNTIAKARLLSRLLNEHAHEFHWLDGNETDAAELARRGDVIPDGEIPEF